MDVFLQRLFFQKENFDICICILSQCIVHLINCWNIYTFPYQETLLHALFYLLKTFSVSLS